MNDAKQDLTAKVAAAWAAALDAEPADVPLDTSFFEAGGDSLLLIVLLEELTGLTDRTLEAADLFQHNTVRAQVALLGNEVGVHEPTLLGARARGSILGRARSAPRSGEQTGDLSATRQGA